MKNAIEKKTSNQSKKTRVAVNSTASKKGYKPLKNKTEETCGNRKIKLRLLFILITLAIVFVCISGAFDISEIVVEGNEMISEEQIISFSEIEKGTNLFAISKKEIMHKIKENSYVDEVQIQRCFPNQVKLIVKERKVKYALPLANSYVYINQQGYVLEISNQSPKVPIIVGFTTDLSNIKENNRLEENDLNKMKTVIQIMETAYQQKMDNLITQIDISNPENYSIYLQAEGKIAYLGKGTELNTRFLYIKAILKDKQGKTGKIMADVDLNSEYVYFREESI